MCIFFLGLHTERTIFDREQRSKVLKEALLLLFLFLACVVEKWAKNVPNRTKFLQENKKCAREQKNSYRSKWSSWSSNSYFLWHIMVLNCRVFIVLPCVASFGLACLEWPSVVLHGLVWFFMALYCLVLSFIAFYCLLLPLLPLLPFMVFYGLLWSFLSVVDPNSFVLVFSGKPYPIWIQLLL